DVQQHRGRLHRHHRRGQGRRQAVRRVRHRTVPGRARLRLALSDRPAVEYSHTPPGAPSRRPPTPSPAPKEGNPVGLKSLFRAPLAFTNLRPNNSLLERETAALARLRPAACDAAALGRLTGDELRSALNPEPLRADWDTDQKRIEPFALPEAAGG